MSSVGYVCKILIIGEKRLFVVLLLLLRRHMMVVRLLVVGLSDCSCPVQSTEDILSLNCSWGTLSPSTNKSEESAARRKINWGFWNMSILKLSLWCSEKCNVDGYAETISRPILLFLDIMICTWARRTSYSCALVR